MIMIDYEVKSSPVHGAGLFTRQDIRAGDLIAVASPSLDVNITPDVFESLTQREQDEILYWGFFDENYTGGGVFHVDFDNTKFINHSLDGNVMQDAAHHEMYLVAARDVVAGEELTQNYLEFETVKDLERRGIK